MILTNYTYSFRQPVEAMEIPESGVVFDPDEGDFTERSGYRTITEQIEELISAGERLEDWRKAASPDLQEFEELLVPTPIFPDRMSLMERFTVLQQDRYMRKLSDEAIAAELAKQKEAARQAEISKASEVQPPKPASVSAPVPTV